MAPHLSAVELDHVQQLLQKGKSPLEIHHSLRQLRRRRKFEPPHITNLRRVLKGLTYERSAVERRKDKAYWCGSRLYQLGGNMFWEGGGRWADAGVTLG